MSIKLIQGDCLEEMKKIPDNSIDLVLTDPPYGVLKDFSWDNKNYFLSSIKLWISEMLRVVKAGGGVITVLCRKVFTSHFGTRTIFSKIAYLG